jgi:hypothetical protein
MDQLGTPAVEEGVLTDEEGIGPSRANVAKAALILPMVLALRTWVCNPMARAAAPISLIVVSIYSALAGYIRLRCSAQRAVRAIRNSKSLSDQSPQLLGSKPPCSWVKTPTCKNHLLKRVWESVRRAGVGKRRQATVYVQEIPALGRRALAIREAPMRCAARLPWCSHALP